MSFSLWVKTMQYSRDEFPQCNPSIKTHNAWQLEPSNSKQLGWECDAAEGGGLSFHVIFMAAHLASAREAQMILFTEQTHRDLSWSAQYTVFRDTHVHTLWTTRHWTVTWQPHIQIHTQESGLFTVQRMLTCTRARQAVPNKQTWIHRLWLMQQTLETPGWRVEISVCENCNTSFHSL